MPVHVDKITKIKEMMKRGKRPPELLNTILKFLDFKNVEIELYNLLLKGSMTITQIEKELKVSERTVREYMKSLLEKEFIVRKVEAGKRLKYVYSALPPEEAWKKMKKEINKIMKEMSRIFEKATALI